MSDAPKGCLGCNPDEIRQVFEMSKIDIGRFSEVPRPRHKWNDVVCCDECGRAWLVAPAQPKGDPHE